MRIYQPSVGGTDSRSEKVLPVNGRDRTIVRVHSREGRSCWQARCGRIVSCFRTPAIIALLGSMSLLSGCFDANAMVAARQNLAQISRLEEVDLGAFLVTLPYQPNSTSSIVVNFHAFGRVAHSNYNQVAKLIEQRGPELRHRMLITVRELNLQELQEPGLDTLRSNIEQVVNKTLPDHPLQAIGFYRFSLLTQ